MSPDVSPEAYDEIMELLLREPSQADRLRAAEWETRAYRKRWERGAKRILIENAAGQVIGSFDLADRGVELIAEEFDGEFVASTICCGPEPALDDIEYREWQLFRRGRGDYIRASWHGGAYSGRSVSTREAATLCNGSGYHFDVPEILFDDLEAEACADSQQVAEPAATEAPPTEAAVEAPAGESAAVQPASSSGAEGVPDRRLWTVEAAQPKVYAYLREHPYATAKAIETETGIPDSTVCKTEAWKRRRFKRRNGKRSGKAKRGAIPLTEMVMAIAEKVAGADDDVEALIARCQAEPEYRQNIETAYKDHIAHERQYEQGRRPEA